MCVLTLSSSLVPITFTMSFPNTDSGTGASHPFIARFRMSMSPPCRSTQCVVAVDGASVAPVTPIEEDSDAFTTNEGPSIFVAV